jgi:predicted acyltransferase
MSQVILKERLASIDVLRGFDMLFLVGAGDILRRLIEGFHSEALDPVYRQLTHVEWIGFTAWDIIMPLFLFTSGLSMPFSFGKLEKQGYTKSKIYLKVLRRFCLLFLFGWMVQGNLLDLRPDRFEVYCNTLHSIAFGYLITALIVLNIHKTSRQLVTGASLVVAYWALLTFVPVPGYGSGLFTPDGNLAMYIDKAVFGSFRDPGSQYTWLLSSLAFGATVYSGYYAGIMLKRQIVPNRKLLQLTLVGVGLIIAGLVLSLQMPIIKKIWSPSMVLYSSGICFLLLAFCYLLTDKLKIDSWWTQAFRELGLNAITAYLVYSLLGLDQMAASLLRGFEQYTGGFFPLVVATGQFAILFFIIHHMYKHKIFLKI